MSGHIRHTANIIAALTLIVAASAVVFAAPTSQVKIPFMKGLTVVYAVSEPQGDYESLHSVASINDKGYRLQVSAQTPNSAEPDIAFRTVKAVDQSYSHRLRDWFSASDPPSFPDTVPGFSRAMLNELASGDTRMVYLEIESGFMRNHVKRSMSGTLLLASNTPEFLPLLVNDRQVRVPVLHGKGKLGDADGSIEVEYFVLADDANPLVLKAINRLGNLRAVRIEYPVELGAPDSIEQQLAKGAPVEVHSIYFAFGSATVRPESQRILKEIATILERHPDWRLQIDGHTDDIGKDTDNLNLSRERAAAVKKALVEDFHVDAARLASAGYGESQPKDTNNSAEGRSRNRRVELRRL